MDCREAVPVSALAEQQQPVVAQAVFLISAGVTAEEILYFLRGRFLQA